MTGTTGRTSYRDLMADSARHVAQASAIPAGSFDVVYDNNGKDLENCQALIDHFKVTGLGGGDLTGRSGRGLTGWLTG